MPHYYFDVRAHGTLAEDEEGRELPDLKAVEAEAAEAAIGIGCEEFAEFSVSGGNTAVAVEVRDEHGARVLTASATISLCIIRADR